MKGDNTTYWRTSDRLVHVPYYPNSRRGRALCGQDLMRTEIVRDTPPTCLFCVTYVPTDDIAF